MCNVRGRAMLLDSTRPNCTGGNEKQIRPLQQTIEGWGPWNSFCIGQGLVLGGLVDPVYYNDPAFLKTVSTACFLNCNFVFVNFLQKVHKLPSGDRFKHKSVNQQSTLFRKMNIFCREWWKLYSRFSETLSRKTICL